MTLVLNYAVREVLISEHVRVRNATFTVTIEQKGSHEDETKFR
jgi:hypothetical protein